MHSQQMLARDHGLATTIGRRRFPPASADIIATLVERDLPFYDPVISEAVVAAMNDFAQAMGILDGPVGYDAVVATRFRDLWSSGQRATSPTPGSVRSSRAPRPPSSRTSA